MSYLALYRKYRPVDFDDVYGQEEVVTVIKNAIANGKVSHAYLFSGPRGTGKTTVAKIIARLVNCEHLVDSKPCGKCYNCLNFNNSNDIVEIDAASNNGVDEIRELRDKINLVPSNAKYKVYIIDEVHMLTNQAFNALLKTLEEPPSHVIFILATTEPSKIPLTISSRCQKFRFSKISDNKIVDRLKDIVKLENINIDNDALFEIARVSDGGMRDSINMLDQLISYSNSKIPLSDVYAVNGSVSYDELFTLINDIYNNITVHDVAKEEELYNRLKEINKNKSISSINNFINDDNEKYNSSFNENNIVNPDNNNGNSHISNINSQFSSSDITYDNTQNQAISTESIKSESKAKFPDLRIIGQFNKTYILAEYADTLYIIDQHAAHEKILYEKYSKDIENGEIVVQQLLLPCLIDLSLDDYECYNENKDIFINSGFVIEEFGGNTISLKEVPYFLGKLDAKNFLLSIIDNLKNLGSGKTVEVKLNKIATMACKAAVKANDYLTQLEMEKLISDLRYIDNPFNCPHGRPIIIKFTEYELDKKFRRIV